MSITLLRRLPHQYKLSDNITFHVVPREEVFLQYFQENIEEML